MPRAWAFQLVQIAGITAFLWALVFADIAPAWWALAVLSYFVTSCLGMAIGVHRALTHRAFRLARPLEVAFSLFGALGMTGSPLGWIAIHRTHHAHADTDHDPHGPGQHGWKMVFTGAQPVFEWWRVRDILRDPFQRALHRYYLLIVGGWALALWLIHPLALVFGFLIPAAAQITVTNLSTILGHGHGYRNFETSDDSSNNVLIAALTWGEGWHNNHHARPRRWTLGRRRWELDPAAWIIRLLVLTGGIDRESFVDGAPFGGAGA